MTGRGLHHGTLLLLLGLGLLASIWALIRLCLYWMPLGWWFESFFPLVVVLEGLGPVAAAMALFRWSRAWKDGSWTSTSLGAFRLFFYVFLAHWLISLIALQPFRRLVFDLSLGPAVAAVSLLLLCTPVNRTGGRRKVEVVLVNLGLLLLGSELLLRAVGPRLHSPVFARAQDYPVDRINRTRYAPGTLRYGFPCNELGHYDEEFEPDEKGRRVVVCIGDSFSAGVVPHYHHFTTVCEREVPGLSVFNMGLPSIDPRDYLYLLQYEALPLNPERVVINLFMGNDLQLSTEPAHHDRGLRSWYDRENLLLYLVPSRIRRALSASGKTGASAVGSAPGEQAAGGRVNENPRDLSEAFPWVLDPLQEESNMTWSTLVEIETRSAQDGWLGPEPAYSRLFDVLEEMRAVAGRTPLAIMLIPARFQVDDELGAEVRRRVPEVAAEPDRPQRILRRWCVRRGIPVLDLLPALRDLLPLADGKRHAYHFNDTHFNARGNEVAGLALAEFLNALQTPSWPEGAGDG